MSYAQNRYAVLHLVRPPKAEYVAQVNALRDAPAVDTAVLLAAIVAARDAGVSASELRPAVARLQEARMSEVRALRKAGRAPSVLMDAGYTSAELFAAGHTATQLREAGFSLASLEKVGYTLRELMEAGHSAVELHSAGHTLSELHAAGLALENLNAMACGCCGASLALMSRMGVSQSGRGSDVFICYSCAA